MKTKSLIALATLTAALSFGASAASLVSNQQAETLQPLNQTISISGHDGDQTNIRQATTASLRTTRTTPITSRLSSINN